MLGANPVAYYALKLSICQWVLTGYTSAMSAGSSDDLAERRALCWLMRDWPDKGLADYPVLCEWVDNFLPSQADPVAAAQAVFRAKLSDPALTSPALLAAAWLLEARPLAPEQVKRDTKRELDKIIQGAPLRNFARSRNKVSRQIVAYHCLLSDPVWDRQKSGVHPANAFKFTEEQGPTKRMWAVAEVLETAAETWFKEVTKDPSSFDKLTRQIATVDKQGFVLKESHPSAEALSVNARAFVTATADRLDEAPHHYPQHLRPTLLASPMTVSGIARVEDQAHSDSLLYSPVSTWGGNPALQELASHRRALLRGNPGSGKSTLLAARVTEHVRANSYRVAAFVRLSDLAAVAVKAIPRSAEEAIALVLDVGAEAMALPVEQVRSELVLRLTFEDDALIALDGLDEVPAGAFKQAAFDVIRHLNRIPGTILITSRHTGFIRPPGEWGEFSVDHLTFEQGRSFLESWFNDMPSEARARAEEVLSDPEREELGQTPVLLGIVALVAEMGTVPATTSGLYERYIGLFLQRVWKPIGTWRSDPVELLRLIGVARRIAWGMVAGRSADGVLWRDLISQHEILTLLPESDTEDVTTLVEKDGLLVAHGWNDAPLFQPLRWIHRTIHEHLVGMYLVDLLRRDSAVGLQFIAEAVQGPSKWSVVLQHIVSALDIAEQEQLLSFIADMRDEGDPGNFMTRALENLACAASQGSAVRERFGKEAAARQSWGAAFRISGDIARSALFETILNDKFDSDSFTPYRLQPMPVDEKFARDLNYSLGEHPPIGSQWWYANSFAFLAQHSPDESLREYAAAVERGLDKMPDYPSDFFVGVSPGAIEDAIVVATRIKEPQARALILRLLQELGVDLLPYARPFGQLEVQEVQLLNQITGSLSDLSNDRSISLHAPVDDVGAALAGKAGAFFAYAFGYFGLAKFIEPAQLSPWGKVGAWQYAFNQSPWAPFEVVEGLTLDEAKEVLAQFTHDWYSDADQLVQLYQALAICRTAPEKATLDLLVELYRRINIGTERIVEGILLEFDVVELGSSIVDILAEQPDDAISAFMSTDPHSWEFSDGYIGALRKMLEIHENDETLVLLAKWADRAKLQILASFPAPRDVERFLDRLLQEIDAKRLLLPQNLDFVADWLANVEKLASWRPRLLELAPESSKSGSDGKTS